MGNYTQRLIALGKPEAALPWARKVFQRRTALYGPDHGATLTARGRLLIDAQLPPCTSHPGDP